MDSKSSTHHISVWLFICLLISLTAFAIHSIPKSTEEVMANTSSHYDLVDGKAAAAFEESLEDKLLYNDMVTGMWGALRYLLFDTGSKGVVIGKNGWLFTDEEFTLDKNYQQHRANNISLIQSVHQILAEKNIKLVIAIIPAKSRIYANHLGNKKRPEAWEDIDQLPSNLPVLYLKERFAKHRSDPIYMERDTHWSPLGAEHSAAAIADYVLVDRYTELALTPKHYYNKFKGTESYDGDLINFVPTGYMKTIIGPHSEKLDIYTTTTDAPAQDGLFDEETIEVVLVGTSYSAKKHWNFEGFLKRALMADVLNLADEGTGPVEPMIAFLNSKQLNDDIKLVIWEFPERFLPVDYSQLSLTKPNSN